ncbi:hypothetical protein GCM10010401_17980 [Rarobacter faecitabidus]|uniref:DNA-binding MarR family transcriptional regulator n=1 Tax=Rarobacter faecitabidus TaxID=13243 RepID=A0A542ZUN5_RARFA|nr:MarR family transcriptional regulator [Rarobacter faecitabidus]TQL64009.1 DNA-binding MarR family transcriptional regulator [Rarobacter faecitabidus]
MTDDTTANEAATDLDDTESQAGPTNLAGRLLYLTVLMRMTDARLRRGHGRRAGILEGQGRVLRLLNLHSPITQKELGYLLGIRSQSLGELLTKLEDADQVKRSPNPQDKRTTIVEITDSGRDAVSNQAEIFDEDTTFGLESAELDTLIGLLDKLIGNIEGSVPGGVDRRLQKMRAMWFGDGADPEDFRWFGGPGGPGGRPGRGGRGGHGRPGFDRGEFRGDARGHRPGKRRHRLTEGF